MRVERIKAATLREALSKIKVRLGEDAVVLHSRTVNGEIEVIAAQDSEQSKTGKTWLDEVIKRDEDLRAKQKLNKMKIDKNNQNVESEITYNRQSKGGQTKQEKVKTQTEVDSKCDKLKDETQDKPYHRDLSHLTIEQLEQVTQKATEFSELLRKEIKSGQEQRQLWFEHEKQLDNLKREMIDLKESLLRQELMELKQRTKNLKSQKKTAKTAPVKPDNSFYDKVKIKLVEKGFTKDTADKIVSRIKIGADSLDLEFTNQAHIQMLKNILSNEIKKLIPVYHIQNGNGKQKIITLFGPRNSGKTLTSIKLALQALIVNDKRVALAIFGDVEHTTFRNLNKLTKAANIPLISLSGTNELHNKLQQHSDKDIIVIDCSIDLNSQTQVDQLIKFLSVLQSQENHLIIPANIKQTDIARLKQNTNKFSFKSIILTKMDDLKNAGMFIELLHQFGKPVSYICNGQTIPDDIEIANAAKLTHMILKG